MDAMEGMACEKEEGDDGHEDEQRDLSAPRVWCRVRNAYWLLKPMDSLSDDGHFHETDLSSKPIDDEQTGLKLYVHSVSVDEDDEACTWVQREYLSQHILETFRDDEGDDDDDSRDGCEDLSSGMDWMLQRPFVQNSIRWKETRYLLREERDAGKKNLFRASHLNLDNLSTKQISSIHWENQGIDWLVDWLIGELTDWDWLVGLEDDEQDERWESVQSTASLLTKNSWSILTKDWDSEGFDDGSDFVVGVYDEGLDDDVDVSLSWKQRKLELNCRCCLTLFFPSYFLLFSLIFSVSEDKKWEK
jgi:hypothetical protein